MTSPPPPPSFPPPLPPSFEEGSVEESVEGSGISITSPELGSVVPEPPLEDGVVLSEGSVEPDPLFLDVVEPGSVAIGSSPSEVAIGSALPEPEFEEEEEVPSDGADVLSVVEEELEEELVEPLSAVPVEDSAGADVASVVAVPEAVVVPAVVVVVVASLEADVVVVDCSAEGDSLGTSTAVAS